MKRGSFHSRFLPTLAKLCALAFSLLPTVAQAENVTSVQQQGPTLTSYPPGSTYSSLQLYPLGASEYDATCSSTGYTCANPPCANGYSAAGTLKHLYSGVFQYQQNAGCGRLAFSNESCCSNTISTTGTTSSGTTAVSSVASTSGLWVGMSVSGTGIAGGTTITAIPTSSSLTLSQNATASNSGVTLSFTSTSLLSNGLASAPFACSSANLRYGLSFDTEQLFQSFLTPDFYSFVNYNESQCPATASNWNWILARMRAPDAHVYSMNATSSSLYIGGSLQYTASTGVFAQLASPSNTAFTLQNLSSSNLTYGLTPYGGDSCDDGPNITGGAPGSMRMQATGSYTGIFDQYAYAFFGSHTFAYFSSNGSPLVAIGVPQLDLTANVPSTSTPAMTYLSNYAFTGFYSEFDSSQACGTYEQIVYLYPMSGSFPDVSSHYVWQVFAQQTVTATPNPYSGGDTLLGTLTCTSLNNPLTGFCSGTISMGVNGNSGTSNVACEIYPNTVENLMVCAAVRPNIGATSFSSLILKSNNQAVLAVSPNPAVINANVNSTGTSTVTLQNLSNRYIDNLGDPALGVQKLQSPFTDIGAFSGAGNGGSCSSPPACGSALAPYSCCQYAVTFSPTSYGTVTATSADPLLRVAYDTGIAGTVNATSILYGAGGVTSLAINSGATGAPGSSENFTATATYGNSSTQNVTAAVAWSSSNTNVVNINNMPGFLGNGSASLSSLGTSTLTATLGTILGTLSFTVTYPPLVSLVAGTVGSGPGKGSDGIPIRSSLLYQPEKAVVDSSGNLYITDEGNNRIQMVPAATGTYFGQSMTANDIYTIAGNSTGNYGNTGNGGAATSALLSAPNDVTVDSSGNLYIADSANNRIQLVPKATGTYFGQSMTANDMYTIAGSSTGASGLTGDGGAATNALLHYPYSIAMDSSGNLYIADRSNNRVQMVSTATGTYFGQSMTANDMYTIAGSSTGASGHNGNAGPATSALLSSPCGVMVDSSGNLYIADRSNNRVQMVSAANGTYFAQSMTANDIYTIAGSATGTSGISGDGGAATSALLSSPYGVTVDSSGNLYIADGNNNRVQMVSAANGTYFAQSMTANDIYTIAGSATGTAGISGDGGAATSALLSSPYAVTVDSSGNLYIADGNNGSIRVVPAATGTYFGQSITANAIYTIAGGGGSAGLAGDGGAATSALLNNPYQLTVDSSGNVYIADYVNDRIQVVPQTSGTYFGQSMTANDIYTVAGNSAKVPGHSGDGGAATSALLVTPHGVTVDSSGNLYIADTNNNRIQMVPKTTGTYFGQSMTANDMYTIAGNSTGNFGRSSGVLATSAYLDYPVGAAVDSSGNLYIADSDNYRIMMVPKTTGTYFGKSMTANDIYTIAGSDTGGSGVTGDGGAATGALLYFPDGVTVDSSGNLYIADTNNNRIQMVPKTTGTYFGQSMTANDIYTIAGSSTGASGLTGDGGAATNALLHAPDSIAMDSSGNLYIADTGNSRIQMVPVATGLYFGQSMTANDIYTVGGSSVGSAGYGGDGGYATSALFYFPTGIAVDSSGNLYVAGNNLVREILAGSGVIGSTAAYLTLSDGLTYNFGAIPETASASHTFTLTNSGTTSATSLSAGSTEVSPPFTLSGGFPGTGGTCGSTLAGGSSCTIVVSFSPTSAVTSSDTLTIAYFDGTNNQTAIRVVTGTGAAIATLTLSDGLTYDFGSITVNSSANHTFTLTNSGDFLATSLGVGSPAMAAPFAFAGGSYPGTGGTCGTTLGSGEACTVVLTFSPTSAVSSSNTLRVVYFNGTTNQTASRAVTGSGL